MTTLPSPVLAALPGDLPRIDTARLPALYETAKTALAHCAQIDECKEWSDRMEALASYARQSEDDALLKHAMRIKCRATDRCGEILHEIPTSRGRQPEKGDALPRFTRTQAAADAGLSPDQAKTALRVNNVPRDQFEAMVESDEPPTIETLAELGTRKRAAPVVVDDYLHGRNPADFEQATRLIGLFTWINDRCGELDITAALRGLNEREAKTMTANLNRTIVWLAELQEALDGL